MIFAGTPKPCAACAAARRAAERIAGLAWLARQSSATHARYAELRATHGILDALRILRAET